MAEAEKPSPTPPTPPSLPPATAASTAPSAPSAPSALENAPPQPPSATGGWALNGLIVAACALFAFSGFWLYRGYQRQMAQAQAEQAQREQERAVLQGALGPGDLQPAADTALRFLTARPEFAAEVGELLEPDKPVEYRMQLTDELGAADDVKFRMTVRGAKAHVWYDTILRPAQGEWQLLSATLTVPDGTQPDGRRVVKLLEPPLAGQP